MMTISDLHPFTMPKYLAHYRVLEKEWGKQERRRQRTLKVHQKGLPPVQNRRRILMHELEEAARNDMLNDIEKVHTSSKPDKTLEWDCRHIGSCQEFVEKQREISRLMYSKAVVEQRIKDLQEWKIREDAECVDEEVFLNYMEEEINKMTMAINTAEEYKTTMKTLTEQIKEKKQEIKKMKRNIAKFQEMMDLEKECEEILWSLSPPEWQKQQEARKQIAEKIKASSQTPSRRSSLRPGRRGSVVLPPIGTTSSKVSVQSNKRKKTEKLEQGIVGNLEIYEKPQIYFTDSTQLLNIMLDMQAETNRLLEEKEKVEYLVEFGKKWQGGPVKKMKEENDQCKKQLKSLVETLSEKKETAEELEEKLECFKRRGVLQENKEVLKQVCEKIEQVYIEIPDANPGIQKASAMVTAIENFVSEALEELSKLPVKELKKMKTEYKLEKIARGKREKTLQAMMRRQQREAMREQRALQPVKKKEMFRSYLVKPLTVEERKPGNGKSKRESFSCNCVL
ncbi:uncharacterized protein LOC131365644 isoform X2 [Hemibagrus wyckioides]|uniref:uncharacterized protein LOC131365644 isoform X2 n=1 Tax=Hemibagrus wyckioides TaxID=337641 RepID=UPI00266BB384|nr:uncharacterized protein LOC131365644 isoform X2 [Hemibagrus wyckioides]